MNVNRLKNYLEKLVLLPKVAGKPKKGNCGVLSDSTDKVELVQNTNKKVLDVIEKKVKAKQVVTKEMN